MIGIDVVDVEHFRAALARTPGLEERLFTKPERLYCEGRADPALHLAGTFAAKEAVVKAAGLSSLQAWSQRIEVTRGSGGAPSVSVATRPELALQVSISHDGNSAVAAALRLPVEQVE